MKWCDYSRDQLFILSLECYFGVYFPCCCVTRVISIKLIILWAHKQFAIRVHTLTYKYMCIDMNHITITGTQSHPACTYYCMYCRADSRLAPSQWEMSLQRNAVSHWLGANLKSATYCMLWCVCCYLLATYDLYSYYSRGHCITNEGHRLMPPCLLDGAQLLALRTRHLGPVLLTWFNFNLSMDN